MRRLNTQIKILRELQKQTLLLKGANDKNNKAYQKSQRAYQKTQSAQLKAHRLEVKLYKLAIKGRKLYNAQFKNKKIIVPMERTQIKPKKLKK
jgi:hypothetical protein